MPTHSVTKGGLHKDSRGELAFVNDFDMTQIKRFYQITHIDTSIIRGWQGHQKESKWFYCVKGSFIINAIQPTNWTLSSNEDFAVKFVLNDSNPSVLHIPNGYFTAIKAANPNSILIVYSDVSLAVSMSDDFRFDINTWDFKS